MNQLIKVYKRFRDEQVNGQIIPDIVFEILKEYTIYALQNLYEEGDGQGSRGDDVDGFEEFIDDQCSSDEDLAELLGR